MAPYRGFVIWGAGTIIVLGLFFFFIITGWPGQPNACIYETPDTCFCEAFEIADVEAGHPGTRQPVNTWFNLYALFTAFLVAYFVCKDRKQQPQLPKNLFRSDSPLLDLYIFCVLFLGLGSMWFHGSLTAWGGVVDGFSMYVFVAFLSWYSLRRFWISDRVFWIGYTATVVLFTYLHTVLPTLANILLLALPYLAIEIFIWVKTGKLLIGTSDAQWFWGLAIASVLTATFFWWASHTGNFMCDPNSFFQPHGLLWHPLAGIMAVLLYFYWREADDL